MTTENQTPLAPTETDNRLPSGALLGSGKTMEEQACEYAEALNDIAETLCVDWGNAADIVAAVRKLNREHRQLRKVWAETCDSDA